VVYLDLPWRVNKLQDNCSSSWWDLFVIGLLCLIDRGWEDSSEFDKTAGSADHTDRRGYSWW